jgi:hypothetical protein
MDEQLESVRRWVRRAPERACAVAGFAAGTLALRLALARGRSSTPGPRRAQPQNADSPIVVSNYDGEADRWFDPRWLLTGSRSRPQS